MYIIEKIIKIYFKLTNKSSNYQVRTYEDSQEVDDFVTCKHNFMPIDSTGKILACSKCGYVVKKNRLKKN
jgi:hypothetical protein